MINYESSDKPVNLGCKHIFKPKTSHFSYIFHNRVLYIKSIDHQSAILFLTSWSKLAETRMSHGSQPWMASRDMDIPREDTGGVDFVDFSGGLADCFAMEATHKSTWNPCSYGRTWEGLLDWQNHLKGSTNLLCHRFWILFPIFFYHVLSFSFLFLSSIDPASISYRAIFKTFVTMVESIAINRTLQKKGSMAHDIYII